MAKVDWLLNRDLEGLCFLDCLRFLLYLSAVATCQSQPILDTATRLHVVISIFVVLLVIYSSHRIENLPTRVVDSHHGKDQKVKLTIPEATLHDL